MVFMLALIPISLLPSYFAIVGNVYLFGAFALGLLIVWSGLGVLMDRTRLRARRVLLTSVLYLPALYGLMLLDRPA